MSLATGHINQAHAMLVNNGIKGKKQRMDNLFVQYQITLKFFTHSPYIYEILTKSEVKFERISSLKMSPE